MHLRKLVLACGLASFALSNMVSALGLGEVKLKSTLNQPLTAEVQLLDVKDLTAEQILVSIASAADFERNGVELVHFYTELQFQVIMNGPSGPIVKITSRDPVREPFLNFLIEAKWTSGRLLREYTLLMDLPTFDRAAPQAVQAAQIDTLTAAPQASRPAAASVESTPKAPVEPGPTTTEEKPSIIAEQDEPKKTAGASGTYGPITEKDTLWDIARAVHPQNDVTVHQTMMALQRLNPDAFIRNNINLIKKGQVLRVPDTAEIKSLSKADAVNEFNAQVAAWSGSNGTNSALGAQLDASRQTTTERKKAEPVAGCVKLEAPSSKDKAPSGQGSGSNKGTGKALETELASAMEELDKAKAEKTELSSRVRDLEDQVKTMQRLVDVSNEKLRAMQLTASKKPEPVKPEAAPKDLPKDVKEPLKELPVVDAAKSAAPVEAQVSSEAASVVAPQPASTPAPAVTDAVASSVAAAPKKPLPPKPAKPAVQPEPEKSILDLLLGNILYVGAGILFLGGVAGYSVWNRRKKQAEQAQLDALSEEFESTDTNLNFFGEPEQHREEEDLPLDELPQEEEEETSAVAETGDVVGEADIYIAYGKYDQAEEMLLNGLAKDPSSSDIRLKLLEIYSQTQNVEQFDKHYAALLPIATAFAANRAAELRSNIEGASEFVTEPVVNTAKKKPVVEEEFNLDDLGLTLDEPATPAAHEEFSFDIDLDDASDDDAELERDQPLLSGNSDIVTANSYDLDFEDTDLASDAKEDDDDFVLELDDEPVAKPQVPQKKPDFSFNLDKAPAAKPHAPLVKAPEAEEELSFDLGDEELEEKPPVVASPVKNTSALINPEPRIAEVTVNESIGDDFNLDMDVNNMDLAALDDEMASLDAELEMLDESSLDAASIESEFAELDADLGDESLSEIESGLLDGSELEFEGGGADDKDDFGWEAPVVEEFSVEEDDFMSDSPAEEVAPLMEVAEEDMNEDDVFDQALSDFSVESLAMDGAADLSDTDMDAELDFMADADEAATKLDLARAYIDMGDNEGARDILAEVTQEGNDQQRKEATELLSRIDV